MADRVDPHRPCYDLRVSEWAGFVEAWLARAAGDRRLRAIGDGTDAAFTLRSGADVTWIHLRDGAPVDHALDDGLDRRVDFGLSAPPIAWERLWSPQPPLRHQSLFALVANVPELHVEGSREAFAQHAHVVARLLELGRPPGPMAQDDGPADLSGISGRYVPVSLSVGDAQLFVEEAGGGRDLLLLHTAGSDSRQYHHLLADLDLRRDWRMAAFDMPAHGRSSSWPEGEWRLSTDLYVECVMAAVDALELERPVVLGCSMGGQICLELALRHPDRFAAAIACQAADRVQGRQSIYSKHARVNEKLFVPEWIDGLMSPHTPPARRAEVRWAYSQGAHGVYWGDIDFYAREWDARERVGRIDTARCPVHILCGEWDYSCTPELARATAARIPGATFTLMRGLGHFPMAEQPRAFLSYLRPLLAELTAASPASPRR
jgi:pimeloyl-ACP methyl ester carboxylesterase